MHPLAGRRVVCYTDRMTGGIEAARRGSPRIRRRARGVAPAHCHPPLHPPIRRSEHVCRTDDDQPLALYRRRPDVREAPPVLLVHGLAQNRHTWELSDRSFAAYLAAEGFDVWLAELRGHGRSRERGAAYARGFADYADRDVPALLAYVRRRAGGQPVRYVGHSLGGVLGLCQHRRQTDLAGVAALASPLRLGAAAPSLQALAWAVTLIERGSLLRYAAGAPVPGEVVGWLNRLFLWWLDRPGNPFPLALWAPGSIPRHAARELTRAGFDRTGIGVLRFIMRWARTQEFFDPHTGEDLADRLARLEVPVLLAGANRDPIVPHAAIEPGGARLGSRRFEFEMFGDAETPFGHFDIVLGDAAPARVWPRVRDWLRSLD